MHILLKLYFIFELFFYFSISVSYIDMKGKGGTLIRWNVFVSKGISVNLYCNSKRGNLDVPVKYQLRTIGVT